MEFETLVTEQLGLIRSGLSAMETGLNNVFAHLIKREKTDKEAAERLRAIEGTIDEIKEALRGHMEAEDARFQRLEDAIAVSRETYPPPNGSGPNGG